MKRRAFVAGLLLLPVGLAAKSINSKGSRSAGADPFPNITAPGGAASFTANWGAQAGADGYLVYLNDGAYRYKASGGGTTSLAITGIAAGNYTWQVATYEGSTVGDLSLGAITVTAA